MQFLSRLVVVLALGWLALNLFGQARVASAQEEVDGVRVMMLFGGVVLVGALAGGMAVVSFLPELGDRIGNFFFNPSDRVEANPHSKALGYVARGDYQAAIAEYQRYWQEDPSDTLALSEITHLYCDKLHDPAPAAEVLESALNHDLSPGDAAFLSSRLVDVYWNYMRDGSRARMLLQQIVDTLPGTKHAANANHRLQEIERYELAHG